MSSASQGLDEARQAPRLKLPPMYTFVRVRPRDHGERYCWTGYVYDISASGMRFELDEALEPGTDIEARAMLPGAMHTTINVSGRVVRLHDDDELAGPQRMGMTFDQFISNDDEQRLTDYLSASYPMAA